IHLKFNRLDRRGGNFPGEEKSVRGLGRGLADFAAEEPGLPPITGDHSTPCVLKGHSWHPQPVLLHSGCSGSDKLERFTETNANSGSLGLFEARYLIRLMQANAKMFDKFGA